MPRMSSPWPEPFWNEPSRILSWEGLSFRATAVRPRGDEGAEDSKLPLTFYFTGLGAETSDQRFHAAQWLTSAPHPFVLVEAIRPEGMWWFLSSDQPTGFRDGEFIQTVLDKWVMWMHVLAEYPGIEKNEISIMGFSAGAYAITELLADPRIIPLRAAIVGGLHGHGQPDGQGIRRQRQRQAIEKWGTYIRRFG